MISKTQINMNLAGLTAEAFSEQNVEGNKVYMEIQVPEGMEPIRRAYEDMSGGGKGMSNITIGLVNTSENN